MKTIVNILIIALVGIVLSFPVMAAPTGYLILERGIIKIRRNMIDKVYRQTNQQIPVDARDEIQTGRETKARIYLRQEDEQIDLYSNSFFTINVVDEEKSSFYLPIGKIQCFVKPFSKEIKRRQFRLRTVTAVIDVKGTKFMVHASGLATNILTLSGVLTVANLAKPDMTIEIGANQASKVNKKALPTPPIEVPKDVQERIIEEDTEAEWKGVEFKETTVPEETKEKKETEEADESAEIAKEPLPYVPDLIPDVEQPDDTSPTTKKSIIFTIKE
ncbi:FecR domain-containing protein [bacterium]|nr:FecR domain-containing protein [bacterium]